MRPIFAIAALVSAVGLTGHTARLQAQAAIITGRVTDSSGRPLEHAGVATGDGQAAVFTSRDGQFAVPALAAGRGPTDLHITASGFRAADVSVTTQAPLAVMLTPEGSEETVVVSAYGAPLSAADSPANTLVISNASLAETAGQALDDKLRQVPGFELFRRTSSLVANPTSQGLSLRGLGSTAASRTLVLSDDDPLNDPYGGWIHWDEIPELAIQSVNIVRGGASDLYGSSAIGGVVDLTTLKPTANTFQLLSSYGTLNTLDDAALVTTQTGKWYGLATGGVVRTDGYTLVAPDERGPVDIPSFVKAENGRVEGGRSFLKAGSAFVRGNVLNESRSNGTPLTTNATRLWRMESGADWSDASGGSLMVRLHGTADHYRQIFSSVGKGRLTESETRFVETPATELGGAVRWTQALQPNLLVLGGSDTRDVRAEDEEIAYSNSLPSSTKSVTARQRQTGLYGEVLWTPQKWTISAGGRVDFFRTFDATQYAPVVKAEPQVSETVFDPRIGVLRHLTSSFAVAGTAFRAYRAPTQNELYRTGQVGQTTTLSNPDLLSERATGWETGVILSPGNSISSFLPALRASYFWTEVNRPITALTITTTPTAITAQRENLGQIRGRGVSIDADFHPLPWLTATGGYQFANATVTQYKPNPLLPGKWIPQVAHNVATAQLQAAKPKLGLLRLEGRVSGHQFDDDANAFRLSGFFQLDGYASHSFPHGLELYAEGQNMLDRTIQAGRTPVLTLGTPLIGTIGVHWRLGE
jgi:outer membrane receptor protein involved in Fe transport